MAKFTTAIPNWHFLHCLVLLSMKQNSQNLHTCILSEKYAVFTIHNCQFSEVKTQPGKKGIAIQQKSTKPYNMLTIG